MAKKVQNTKPLKKERSDRVALPNELLAKIALKRLAGLPDSGRLTPIKEVAAEYKRAYAVISRAIPRAFKKRLIEFKALERPALPPVNEDLEHRVLNKYTKLNVAIVIKTDSSSQDSDAVHRRLGMAMAAFIASGSVIQNGNAVGVGSGRGVDMTLDCLGYFEKLRARDVKVMSLTGSVYGTPNQATKRTWLDADRHVVQLAQYFLEEPKQYLICHPLAYELADLEKARSRIWLRALDPNDEDGRKMDIPAMTHLLLGVGTVAKNHRFYIEAAAKLKDQEAFLKPIHKLLVRLVSLCETAVSNFKHLAPFYSPAAEMSNFFFYVPPPPGKIVPNEEEIKSCIRQINARLLNALSSIQDHQPLGQLNWLVVAGTKEKAHALRALLENDRYPVTYLCTDEQAALEIVEGRA